MLTLDQLEKWAPDAATLERARILTSPRKWKQPGAWQDFRWALARTDGATRHTVLLRLSDAAFFCSCTVRKKPCKHVLALAQMALKEPEGFSPARSLPEWAEELVDRLEYKPGEDLPAPDAAPSPEALEQRRRNREKRLEQMAVGMEELDLWLADRIRQGLGHLEAHADELFERFAARMVDAKLGSIGRRVRTWKRLMGKPGWQDQILAEIADLFLLVRAFRQAGQLPEPLVQDLLQVAGMSIKKEELLQNPGLDGLWTVLGLVEGEDDKLRYRRTWLQHAGTGRYALLLDFAWGDQAFEHEWKTGQQFEGSLVYYPSAFPQRAIIHEMKKIWAHDAMPLGLASAEALQDQYALALAAQPWLSRFPVFLENFVPAGNPGTGWNLADAAQAAIPLSCPAETGWMLLSLSGGHPIDLFGEWDGATFSPLSCLYAGRWIQL